MRVRFCKHLSSYDVVWIEPLVGGIVMAWLDTKGSIYGVGQVIS